MRVTVKKKLTTAWSVYGYINLQTSCIFQSEIHYMAHQELRPDYWWTICWEPSPRIHSLDPGTIVNPTHHPTILLLQIILLQGKKEKLIFMVAATCLLYIFNSAHVIYNGQTLEKGETYFHARSNLLAVHFPNSAHVIYNEQILDMFCQIP